MATRVTPTEVKEILTTTLADPVIQVWIDAANSVVNSVANCIGGDTALLTQVELYLSSHFVALVDPDSDSSISSTKKEKTEELSTEYNMVTMTGKVTDTVYGRTANMLSKGCLLKIDKEVASVDFL